MRCERMDISLFVLLQVLLSKLKGIEEFSGDYITLEKGDLRGKILSFYAQNYFKACDYCQDYSKPRVDIQATIQTDEVLRIGDRD